LYQHRRDIVRSRHRRSRSMATIWSIRGCSTIHHYHILSHFPPLFTFSFVTSSALPFHQFSAMTNETPSPNNDSIRSQIESKNALSITVSALWPRTVLGFAVSQDGLRWRTRLSHRECGFEHPMFRSPAMRTFPIGSPKFAVAGFRGSGLISIKDTSVGRKWTMDSSCGPC
jgi:hypothetical protein